MEGGEGCGEVCPLVQLCTSQIKGDLVRTYTRASKGGGPLGSVEIAVGVRRPGLRRHCSLGLAVHADLCKMDGVRLVGRIVRMSVF
jgi:hypothetical protein